MFHIFISYSRKDIDYAQIIVDALARTGLDTWIDWKSIPKGEDWFAHIQSGIEESDTVLVLVSPDSVQSKICGDEIDHAVRNGKRILPLVIRDVDPKDVHHEIASRNWIFCRNSYDELDKAIEETRQAIHTDYDWLKYHSRLQVKALEWERSGDTGRLLRGRELREAEDQFAEVNSRVDPQPTELQRRYLLNSRRNQEKQRRRMTLGFGLGFAFVVVLAVFAWGQRNLALDSEARAVAEADARSTALFNEKSARETSQADKDRAEEMAEIASAMQLAAEAEKDRAEEQAKIALAMQLAAQSQVEINKNTNGPLISVLLAIEAYQRIPSQEAEQSLRQALAIIPVPLFVLEHDQDVISFSFSPDGKFIVTADRGNTINVWNIETKSLIFQKDHEFLYRVIYNPNGQSFLSVSSRSIMLWNSADGTKIFEFPVERPQNVVAFSTDGNRFLMSAIDGWVRVISTRSGQEISRFKHKVPSDSVWPLVAAFSPDGSRVISGGKDNRAIVWSVASGQEISAINHSGTVYAVAISPDGKTAASTSGSLGIVWEAATGKEIFRFSHNDVITSLAFSPDGRWIAANEDCNICNTRPMSVRVWDVKTGMKISQMVHDDHIYSVEFSPDGKYVLTRCMDKTIRVWEAETGREISRMIHSDLTYGSGIESPFAAAFSPSGKMIASSGVDNKLRIWTFQPYPEILRLLHEGKVSIVEFSPDGSMIATGDNAVHLWRMETGEEILRKEFSNKVRAIAFSPDGSLLAAGGFGDVYVHVWDVKTAQEIIRMRHDHVVNAVSFSPDGKLLVSGSHDFTARVWDVATGEEISRLQHNDIVTVVRFSQDGSKVITNETCQLQCESDEHLARVWDFRTGNVLASSPLTESAVEYVILHPNAKWAASSDWYGIIQIWEMDTGNQVTQFDYQEIEALEFSQDGRLIASGGGDYFVHVWEVSSKEQVDLLAHEDWVSDIAFSPDDRFLLSGSYDKSMRVWDVQTGLRLATMMSEGAINAVAFHPAGQWVASASDDQTVRLWLWNVEALIAEACKRVPRNLTQTEWQKYFGEQIPYHATCPNLPIPEG